MSERLGDAFLRLYTDDRELERGIDRARRSSAELARDLDRFGQRARQVGQSFTLYVTTPIAALGGVMGRVAGDFEAAMNRVAAISGATGDEFAMLRDAATEMGRTTQFSASEAADALGFLAMAGFNAREAVDSLPGTLQLAAAAQMDLATAADIVSNVLSGYALEVAELSRVNDVLVATMTSANTDLQQLGEAMKMAGPVAAAAGVQFEETAATIGLMGNAGIQATMAGTSLRGAIARILDPAKEVSTAMAAAGLSFTDAEGRLIPLVEIIRQLEPHADDAGLFMQLFGQRAGPAMAALVSQGSDALAELTGQLENAGGTAERIAEAQMQGLNGQIARLKSAFEALLIAVGDSGFLETITSLAEGVTDLITALSEASPETLRLATTILALVAAIGPAIWILGLMSSGLGLVIGAGGRLLGLVRLLAGSAGLRLFAATVATATRQLGLFAGAQIAATGAAAGLRVAVTALIARLGPLGAAIALVAAEHLVSARNSRAAAEALATLEERAAASAAQYEQLRAAAQRFGADLAAANAGGRDAVTVLGEMSRWAGSAAEAFDRLGLSARQAMIFRNLAQMQEHAGTIRQVARQVGARGATGNIRSPIDLLLGNNPRALTDQERALVQGSQAEIRQLIRNNRILRRLSDEQFAAPSSPPSPDSDAGDNPAVASATGADPTGAGGSGSGESAVETAQRKRTNFLDQLAALAEQQLSSELSIAADSEAAAEIQRRQVEWRHRELSRRIAEDEDLSAAQRQELQTIVDNIRANEETAAALDALRGRFEAQLAAFDARAEAGDIGRAIADLRQGRGDFGFVTAAQEELLRIERQLADERMQAARRLIELEGQREEARAIGDRAAIARLDDLIGLQRRYADLVDETTAAQIRAQSDLQDALGRFTDNLSDSLLDIVTEFDGSLTSLFNVFKQLLRDLLRPGADNAASGLSGLLQGVLGGIFGGGGKSPAASPGGGAASVLGFTKFAGFFEKGGLIPRGGFGIVGERGPEPVFATPQGAQVFSNSALGSALGGRDVRVRLDVTTDGEWINTRIVDVSGGMLAQAAPEIASAGADEAVNRLQRRSRSSLDGY